MSGGLIGVGTSAMLANQAALQTTGNNIANVNTPGYSRQTAVLEQVQGQFSGAGYIGKGVAVGTVMRSYSDFLTTQANATASQQASDSTVSDQMSQLEKVFQGGASGLGASISTMLNSFSDVASAPADLSARTVALADASAMAARFRSSSDSLDALQAGVQTQLQQSVLAINSLAARIGAVNGQVALASSAGQSPNDLLDQRDQLVSQLNQYVQTTSIPAADGTVGIFLGGSQALVLGTTASALSVGSGTYPGDLSTNTLSLKQSGSGMPMDESNLGGGSMKGLLTFLNKDLQQGRNLLGRMALAIGSVANTQHRLGLDMNGNAGGDLFQASVLPNGYHAASNGGTGTVSMSVTDPSAFVVSDYALRYTSGTAGTITRLSDGQVSNFDFAAGPVQLDGLSLSATPGAVGGDQFLLKPFSKAAAQMDTAFTSVGALAVASPIQAGTGSTNGGGLAVTRSQAVSSDPGLTDTVNLTFDATTGTFDAFDATTSTSLATGVAYTPGQTISFNGWSLTLTGIPKTGDTVTVQKANPNFAATNSGNATALMNLRDMALFDGAPLTDGYASAMSQVGIRAQSAGFSASVSLSLANSAETARTSVAGVNLDEEAAKLLQFQQSYQAAAKMMQIAQSVFNTLIQTFAA